jgi:diguanylate cyclase (GGDEF)-like protein
MIRPNVKTETYILIMTAIADVFAFSLELIFNIGYLLWNTTAFCLVIYFAVINIQTVLYDPLTGAFSRVSYSKRLEKLNKSIKSDNYMFIMIDLDHLKQINDTYGHASGDNAIQTMTGNILSRIDRKMSLYRYGGDEFILICKNTDIQKIEKLLTESQKSCADSNNKDITFSYGMSEYRSGDDLHCVIENADKKMYEMKHLHEQ